MALLEIPKEENKYIIFLDDVIRLGLKDLFHIQRGKERLETKDFDKADYLLQLPCNNNHSF